MCNSKSLRRIICFEKPFNARQIIYINWVNHDIEILGVYFCLYSPCIVLSCDHGIHKKCLDRKFGAYEELMDIFLNFDHVAGTKIRIVTTLTSHGSQNMSAVGTAMKKSKVAIAVQWTWTI